MKRISFIAAATTLFTASAFAQIPVTDAASIARQAASQLETMAKWKLQYDQMISQIEQAKQQFTALTGSRGFGAILNDPSLRQYLPQDWQKVYDSVRTGGYSGLSGSAKAVYDANKIFNGCAALPAGDQQKVCEASAVKPSQDKGFALDAYDKAKDRMNQIDQLMGKINETNDPKAIAELQGRIAVEQANIQNEQTKLQLYAMVSAAEEKVQQQREREVQSRTWAAKGMIKPKAPTFN